jgi:hypothetical protein
VYLADMRTSGMSCLLGLLFHPEDEGSMFLHNHGKLLPDYTESPSSPQYNYYKLRELTISQRAQLHLSTISLQLACACELQLSGYVVGNGQCIGKYRYWACLHWKFETCT